MSWVGRSSVEIVVWLEQKVQDRWRKLTRALFLMACRNATNTAAAVVNPLQPANEEEKKIHTGGESESFTNSNFFYNFNTVIRFRSKTTTHSTSKGIDFQSRAERTRTKTYPQYVHENNGFERQCI